MLTTDNALSRGRAFKLVMKERKKDGFNNK